VSINEDLVEHSVLVLKLGYFLEHVADEGYEAVEALRIARNEGILEAVARAKETVVSVGPQNGDAIVVVEAALLVDVTHGRVVGVLICIAVFELIAAGAARRAEVQPIGFLRVGTDVEVTKGVVPGVGRTIPVNGRAAAIGFADDAHVVDVEVAPVAIPFALE